MSSWWVHDVYNDQGIVALVSWIVWVIGSICLHELGHGIAAIRLGDDTPRELGHMTWNPLVHMGPNSLLVFALIGIAWGAMPVDPSRLRGRHGEAIVAIAGPLVNLSLAVLCLVALPVWQAYAGPDRFPAVAVSDTFDRNMSMFLYMGSFLNLILFAFNLIPVMPLDGGRIAAHYSYRYREFAYSENGRWVLLGAFILIFFTAGRYIFPAAQWVVFLVRDTLLDLLT